MDALDVWGARSAQPIQPYPLICNRQGGSKCLLNPAEASNCYVASIQSLLDARINSSSLTVMARSTSVCGIHDDGEPTDPRQRKRMQNRAAQKTYREKLKRRIEDLEKWRDVALAMASSKKQETADSSNDHRKEDQDAPWNSSLQMLPLESPASPPQVQCFPPASRRPSSPKSMPPDVESLLSFGWNAQPSEPMGMFHDFGLPNLDEIPTRTPPPTDPDSLSPRGNASTARGYEPNAEPVDHTPEDAPHGALLSPTTVSLCNELGLQNDNLY